MTEFVTVTSKGQVTLPSKLRKQLHIAKGEKLVVTWENGTVRMTPTPKLSRLAGVDRELFKGKKSSAELTAIRKQWDEEFEKRIREA